MGMEKSGRSTPQSDGKKGGDDAMRCGNVDRALPQSEGNKADERIGAMDTYVTTNSVPFFFLRMFSVRTFTTPI